MVKVEQIVFNGVDQRTLTFDPTAEISDPAQDLCRP